MPKTRKTAEPELQPIESERESHKRIAAELRELFAEPRPTRAQLAERCAELTLKHLRSGRPNQLSAAQLVALAMEDEDEFPWTPDAKWFVDVDEEGNDVGDR